MNSLPIIHFHALEKEMGTHSGVLAWRIPGTEEPSRLPSRLPSMGSHRVGHDWCDLAAAAVATWEAHKATLHLREMFQKAKISSSFFGGWGNVPFRLSFEIFFFKIPRLSLMKFLVLLGRILAKFTFLKSYMIGLEALYIPWWKEKLLEEMR